MNVIRADAMGLCFGVRDALAAARRVADPGQVTIHGQLVHNEAVLAELDARGFRAANESDRAAIPETPLVMITAHGVSDRERARLQAAGRSLIDTTCPLVARVHKAARELAKDDCFVVVLGRPDHVEVRGIVEDLEEYAVAARAEDVRTWPSLRIGVVSQTTTPPHVAVELILAIRLRNPDAEIRVVDTICQPTRDRQVAVEKLCGQVDAVVVVGGARSNNTRQLVALCERLGTRAFHVQSASDLDPRWLAGCRTVGLTAGTSTLDETIDAVEARLRTLEARS